MNSNWSYSPETLNSGQNRRLFVLCDLEIWRMTLKNNRAPLPCYFKLCASFQSHRSIQTGVTVRKCSIQVQIGDFFNRVTLEFDGWPWKTIGHLFYDSASFVHHFVTIGEFKLGVTVRKRPNWVKIYDFLSRMTLKFNGWPWKIIGHLSLATSSFVHHFITMSIQTGGTVRKRLNWVLTSVTLTFDLWPWPFAWTSLLPLVITPENFMMIRWWEHSEKGVTDRQTDGRTDWTIHRATWSQLKMVASCLIL